MGEKIVLVEEPEVLIGGEMVPVQAMKNEVQTLDGQVRAIQIASQADYESAGAFGVSVQTAIKKIEETFEKPVRTAKAAYDAAREVRDNLLRPLEAAKGALKAKMQDWNAEQRRIAAAAEAKRIADQRKAEEDRRLELAANAETAGFSQAAEEILAAPVAVAPVAPAFEAPKAKGTVSKVDYDFRIVDPSAINRAFLVPDESKIRKLVKALGADAVAQVGGIQVFEKDNVSFRKERV